MGDRPLGLTPDIRMLVPSVGVLKREISCKYEELRRELNTLTDWR